MNQFLEFVGGLLYIIFSIFIFPFEVMIYSTIGLLIAAKHVRKWRLRIHMPVFRFKKPAFHLPLKHFFSFKH